MRERGKYHYIKLSYPMETYHNKHGWVFTLGFALASNLDNSHQIDTGQTI